MIYVVLSVILIVIFLILYSLYQYKQIVYQREEMDVIIVGAGVSGTYIAYRLNQKYPNLKILVIEQEETIGGRLMSIEPISEPSPIKIEAGGMRFFPDLQPRIKNLIKELDLETVQIPYESPENIAYLRGQHILLNTIGQNAQYIYNLYPNERGLTPVELVTRASRNVGQTVGVVDNQWYNSATFNHLSYWILLENQLSNEAIQCYRDTGGYNFTIDDISASVGATEDTNLGQSGSYQTMLPTGYQNLVYTLAKRCSNNVKFITNVTVTNFSYSSSIFKIKTNGQCLLSRSLWLTVLPENLSSLYPWSDQILNVLSTLVPWSAVKIFLTFDIELDMQILTGRNVTDIPIRQLWMYSPRTLLIYCDDMSVKFWQALLPSYSSGGNYRPIWLSADQDQVQPLISELKRQIQLILGREIPQPTAILWRYWQVGAHWWLPTDILMARQQLSRPFGPSIPCYISNSSYSLSQGWVEGALDQADMLLDSL